MTTITATYDIFTLWTKQVNALYYENKTMCNHNKLAYDEIQIEKRQRDLEIQDYDRMKS